MTGLIDWFERFGIRITPDGADLIAAGSNELQLDVSLLPSAAPGLPKLAVRPWPGFPTDVLPVMVALACKMRGRILFQNWMYEHGLQFVHQLNQIGADIAVSQSLVSCCANRTSRDYYPRHRHPPATLSGYSECVPFTGCPDR